MQCYQRKYSKALEVYVDIENSTIVNMFLHNPLTNTNYDVIINRETPNPLLQLAIESIEEGVNISNSGSIL